MYNSKKFIKHKIENILGQTIFEQCEVMFINGGSQDEKKFVEPICEKYENCIYIKSKKRITIYDAWNRGIKASTAPLICYSNTDDVLAPNAMERMCEALESDKEACLAFPRVLTTTNDNPKWGSVSGGHVNTSKKGMKGPFVMWRRSLHDKYGLFDQRLWVIGDAEFWLRIKSEKFIKVNEPLVIYVVRHGMEKQSAPDGELYRVKDAKLLRYPKGWVEGW